MRTEQVVVFVFFALLLPGLGFIIASGGGRNRPPTHPRWTVIGFSLLSFGMLFFGIATYIFTRTSPQIGVSGSIANLQQSHGKSTSSSFDLTSPSGETPVLHTHYDGTSLLNGQQANAVYLAYDQSVVNLTMESGPTSGFHLDEGGGLSPVLVPCIFGLILAFGARKNWQRARESQQG